MPLGLCSQKKHFVKEKWLKNSLTVIRENFKIDSRKVPRAKPGGKPLGLEKCPEGHLEGQGKY